MKCSLYRLYTRYSTPARQSGAITKPSSTRHGVEHASPIAYSHIATGPGDYTRSMADLSNVSRYKIFNNKNEAIEIPASHVLKYPAFEEHFTRTSRSRTRSLDSGRCSCIIDIAAVFLRNGRFYNLHTGQCRCICKSTNFCTRAVAIYDFAIEFELDALAGLVADDMSKFVEYIKPTDVLCPKLMYGEPVTPKAAWMCSNPQLSNRESLRQDMARLVMSLADEPSLNESGV
ncbi:hypothetical protein FOXYS1_8764 [Fusarium oxysporum]|uniref:Uncharacterized protein n=1 Tax=Fusarium oxysporum TaxID=5507 RepID=A0A8H5EIY7_FUSOX|nr:hypothetical protein FOXYS1_8764 [Fusarium oxysporum]